MHKQEMLIQEHLGFKSISQSVCVCDQVHPFLSRRTKNGMSSHQRPPPMGTTAPTTRPQTSSQPGMRPPAPPVPGMQQPNNAIPLRPPAYTQSAGA